MPTIRNACTGISITEVAFFAGVTVEEAIRAVEAQVRSPGLLNLDEGERFAPIVCVFASFYESTKDELSKTARLWIIASVLDRVLRRRDAADHGRYADRTRDADPATLDVPRGVPPDRGPLAPHR